MATALPDATLPDVSDFPARLAMPAALTDVPPPSRGLSVDASEEIALRLGVRVDDDGFPVLSPADNWDRYSAAMSRWIDGRGPRPE